MRTPASIAGHPIHPMVVPVAIGGFLLSFVFDIVCLVTGAMDPWPTVAYYTMIGGIVGALIAAVFGFTDLLSLPAGTTRHVGLTHMGINLTVVVLYIVNAWLRHGNPTSLKLPMLLSLPAGHTRHIGLTHMGINLTVVVLYAINAWLRHGNPESLKLPMLLSLVGVLLLVVSGWLGGKMVFEAGVGVSGGEIPATPQRPARHVEA